MPKKTGNLLAKGYASGMQQSQLISALVAGATVGCLAVSPGCTAASSTAPPDPGSGEGAPDSDFPEASQRVVVEALPEAQSMRLHSGMTTRERVVVRDPATWQSVWSQLVGTVQPAPAAPKVDFTSSVVIVAAMGVRPTGGFAIDIGGASLQDNDAWISVTETSPGRLCVVNDVITSPVTVAVMPWFSGKATFVEHATESKCP